MNRSKFIKSLGIGVAALVAAPTIIAEVGIPSNYCEGLIPFIRRTTSPAIASGYDYMKPAVFDELYKRYGSDLSFFELIKAMEL